MALRKCDLVEVIREGMDVPRKDGERLVEAVFGIIKAELIQGREVMISGFGKWSIRRKNARRGRNPQTGERMTIAARNVIAFKSSPKLKEEISRL